MKLVADDKVEGTKGSFMEIYGFLGVDSAILIIFIWKWQKMENTLDSCLLYIGTQEAPGEQPDERSSIIQKLLIQSNLEISLEATILWTQKVTDCTA